MPFAHFSPDGEIDALFLQEGAARLSLPLSDIRVLRFLQSSDPDLTQALLNASDDAHRMLLSSLISLMVRNQTLPGKGTVDSTKLIPHQSLNDLINIVETNEDDALHSLEQSDRNTVRIIEDVIDILIRHKVIALSDLPQGAQHLLAVRRALRAYLSENEED